MAPAWTRIKQFDIDPAELDSKIQSALGGITTQEYDEQLNGSIKDVKPGSIVMATVDSVDERTGTVVMDIGGKSEGQIAISEFGETLPKPGEVYEVFYEGLDDNDTAALSKRR